MIRDRIPTRQVAEWLRALPDLLEAPGWIDGPTVNAVSPAATNPDFLHPWARQQLDAIGWLKGARAAALEAGLEPGFVGRWALGARPDLAWVLEPEGAMPDPSFDPAWLLTAPRGSLEECWRKSWAGWAFEWQRKNGLPMDLLSGWWNFVNVVSDRAREPIIYWGIDVARRVLWPKALVCDLRNPAYQAWVVERIAIARVLYGADAVTVGLKTGWHGAPRRYRWTPVHGTEERPTPESDYQVAAVQQKVAGPAHLVESQVAPGEWEAATAAVVRGLLESGCDVIVAERPHGFLGRSGWADEDLAARVLGDQLYFAGPSA